MIRYRHYQDKKKFDKNKWFGMLLDLDKKQPTLDIYFGKHVFVWFRTKNYN